MKAVVQRVSHANVSVNDAVAASTAKGLLILLGVEENDTPEDSDVLARKIARLRIFPDSSGRMNLDITNVKGEILSIPQFTLLADMKKGHRPSFNRAAGPELASSLWKRFGEKLREHKIIVREGKFGARMKVSLTNDGPVTLFMDSSQWRGKT